MSNNVSEAGRKGGMTTRATRGHDFYVQIGKKGVAARLARGEKLGRPLGSKNKPKDAEKKEWTVAEAGRKGGETTKQRYGDGYYESIGKKGGARVRELMAAGRRALDGGQ
jgi:general stress protein YciG